VHAHVNFKTIPALFMQAELEMVGSDTVDPIITEIATTVSLYI